MSLFRGCPRHAQLQGLGGSHALDEIPEGSLLPVSRIPLRMKKIFIIVYSCLLVASAAAVLVGAFEFYLNGIAYDTNVSNFAITMQILEISGFIS